MSFKPKRAAASAALEKLKLAEEGSRALAEAEKAAAKEKANKREEMDEDEL